MLKYLLIIMSSQQKRQLNKIIKQIDKLYESNIHTIIKKASPNDKKYLASIIHHQKGGDSDANDSLVDLGLIASGNREIKQIVENLKNTTKSIFEELLLSKQENKILKEKLRTLDKGVKQLDKTKCKEMLQQAQIYIEHFLEVRKAMIGLVAFIKKKVVTESSKLKFLSKPPLEYEDDLQVLQNIQIRNPTCENVQGILDELQEYQDPDILSRILTDYESLSGKVRVIVRIFNYSFVDSTKRKPVETFNYRIVQDNTGIKKIRQTFSSTCELPQNNTCLTPGSVKKQEKYVVRTPYPCTDSMEIVPFRFNYGPFYDVFQNENNKTIFSQIESVFSSLERGNQVVLFGYGYSGSSKTFTLLGNKNELGLLQMTCEKLKSIASNIEISVEELYGRIEPPSELTRFKSQINISSNVIQHGNTTFLNSNQFVSFIENIQTKRKNSSNIKFTSNNLDSSRGHLMIKAKFHFSNGKSSTLMVVDLAGSEDPFVIGPTFLRIDPLALKSLTKQDVKLLLTNITNSNLKIRSTYWDKEFLAEFVSRTKTNINILEQEDRGNRMKIKVIQNDDKQVDQIMNKLYMFYFANVLFGNEFSKLFAPFKIDYVVDYIWNMLTEGFFINESLNHLKIFLQRQGDKQVHIVPAKASHNVPKGIVYKLITADEMKLGADKTRYSPERLLVDPTKNDSIGLLKLLDNFSNVDKVTNYVMIATLRDELNHLHCNGTASTLDFAQQVKST